MERDGSITWMSYRSGWYIVKFLADNLEITNPNCKTEKKFTWSFKSKLRDSVSFNLQLSHLMLRSTVTLKSTFDS